MTVANSRRLLLLQRHVRCAVATAPSRLHPLQPVAARHAQATLAALALPSQPSIRLQCTLIPTPPPPEGPPRPSASDDPPSASTERTDTVIEAHILEVLAERVLPNVQLDGGNVHYRGWDPETGVVTLALAGACIDCASSTVTMRFMIKNVIMHYVPEVEDVVQEGQDDDDDDD